MAIVLPSEFSLTLLFINSNFALKSVLVFEVRPNDTCWELGLKRCEVRTLRCLAPSVQRWTGQHFPLLSHWDVVRCMVTLIGVSQISYVSESRARRLPHAHRWPTRLHRQNLFLPVRN
jgi:hypothetical protein